MKKSKLYFVVVILLAGGFITFWTKSLDAVFSSSAQKTINAQPTPPVNNLTARREQANASKLESLLESEAIEVSEANLLGSPSQKSKILRVQLTATNFSGEKYLKDQAAGQAEMSLLSSKSNGGATSRMRTLELSPTQLLIVSLDAQNRLVWWQSVPDPRLFRAETADDNGRLSGEEKYLETAEMLFALPDDEKISTIRFYHPLWNGARFDLQLVGTLDLKSE